MYSRNTDRGGKRIKLPPGYDGSAFRHDTGEVRRLAGDTEMKIHSPAGTEIREFSPAREKGNKQREMTVESAEPIPMPAGEFVGTVCPSLPAEKDTSGSFLEGLMAALGQEEWLLFLLILLLVADGGDCWDVVLLLGLLLAVRNPDTLSL